MGFNAGPANAPVVALRLSDRDSGLRLELKPNGSLMPAPKEENRDRANLIQDWFLLEEWDSEFERRFGESVPCELKFYGQPPSANSRYPAPPPITPTPPRSAVSWSRYD